jgi:DNA-binding Xre family transcriptional regulator
MEPVCYAGGMIRVLLKEMMHQREVRFLRDLTKDGIGISYPTLLRLYHNTAQAIDLTTLEKLCAFFDCQPGDLLRREE